MQTNPLLDSAFSIPFDRITPEHVEPAMDTLIKSSEQALQAIIDTEGPRTWDNTLAALDEATLGLEQAYTVVGHLYSVANTDALAAAYFGVTPKVTTFFSSIALNADLYQAVKAYAATEEAKTLTGAKARFLQKTLKDFQRHGAELSAEEQERFQHIESRLAELGNQFSQNSLKATAAWSLHLDDDSRLSGVPSSVLGMMQGAAQQAEQTGYRVTLQAPIVMGLLSYAEDAALREQVWRAYTTRAGSGEFNNADIIAEMVTLRAEKARLLGFETFADYVLEERMAHTGSQAVQFLDRLEARSREQFQQENEALAAYSATLGATGDLNPWDISYYAEKQRKALYDLDQEALRPYFAFDNVLSGLFTLVNKLYGVTVEPHDLPVWHEDVQTYKILSSEGRMLGAFYTDFFPRTEKRAGAWMNALITGQPQADGQLGPHLGLMCGNMSPPTDGRPALLTHREVETLFHEFGHLLHHLLTTVQIRGLAGTNVAWDFVELPSQIMENWCWTRETLDLIGTHWETGETLPDELFKRLIDAKNFRSASAMMRQLSFGQLDLAMHTGYAPSEDGDPQSFARALQRSYASTALPDDYSMVTAFGHLFSSPTGYAAGYYSYKWAEVLDADAFTRFAKEGIFNAEVGAAFRDSLLSQGNAADPAELFRNFMGRDPDPEALLRRSGLN